MITSGGVTHSTLRIIHRAGDHTDKWDRDIIRHHIELLLGRPLHLLQTIHTLIVQHVRIGPLKTCRLEYAMEIH